MTHPLLMVHTMYIHIITYYYISYHVIIFGTYYWKSARKEVWPSLLDLVATGFRQNNEIRTFGLQTVGICRLPRLYTLPPLQAQEIIGSKGTIAKFTRSRLKDMRLLFASLMIEDWKMLWDFSFQRRESAIQPSANILFISLQCLVSLL